MWGGLDPATGTIIDHHHPQVGTRIANEILVMASGRGSSSSSSVLAEAIRAGTAPAAILLLQADEIIVLGALVAALLGSRDMPVVQLDKPSFALLRTGHEASIHADGSIELDGNGA
jgi:predicted aconitase with swiveling domain